ncbi:MAG: hypothetical protein ACREQ9_11915 [Candidatus Binatia bacterium]
MGGSRGDGERPGRHEPPRSATAERHGIDAFRLFCAYHLGITEDGGYRFQNVHQVARIFRTNAGGIRQALSELRMDPDLIVQSDFDLTDAQVDVMLAPDGVSRVELAREIYARFRRAPLRKRDWRRELEAAARENERIFGRR